MQKSNLMERLKSFIADDKRAWKLALVLFMFVATSWSLGYLGEKDGYQKGDSLEEYAQIMLDRCADLETKEACYLNEVSQLMDIISLEEAFEIIRIAQESDSWLMVCHTIGHVIGQKEVEKDPDNWVEIIGRCPDFTCSDGCPHGAVIGRFGGDQLSQKDAQQAKEELSTACGYDGIEDHLTPRMYKCIHGVGHLIMFLAEADIEESLAICKSVSAGDDNSAYAACSEGVFMIMHQPFGPDQEDLVEGLAPTFNQIDEFCGKYEGIALESCYNEAFPTIGGGVLDQSVVEDYCKYSDNIEVQDRCLEVLHMVAAKQFLVSDNLTLEDLVDYCGDASTDKVGRNCIRSGAVKVLQQDPAFLDRVVDMCLQAEGIGYGQACFNEISDYFPRTYLVGNESALNEYCSVLPDDWQAVCKGTIDSW